MPGWKGDCHLPGQKNLLYNASIRQPNFSRLWRQWGVFPSAFFCILEVIFLSPSRFLGIHNRILVGFQVCLVSRLLAYISVSLFIHLKGETEAKPPYIFAFIKTPNGSMTATLGTPINSAFIHFSFPDPLQHFVISLFFAFETFAYLPIAALYIVQIIRLPSIALFFKHLCADHLHNWRICCFSHSAHYVLQLALIACKHAKSKTIQEIKERKLRKEI